MKQPSPLGVPPVLGMGGNHLEPGLVYTMKNPGTELHLLLLHLCEAWHCRVEEVFHFLFQYVLFFFFFNAVRVSLQH